MSAASVLLCYGVRYEITADAEIEQLELRTHPRIAQVQRAGLKHRWGRFADREGERTFLFVGAILGDFGPEGTPSAQFTQAELAELLETTRTRLANGGFDEEPVLFVQLAPD